MRDLTIRADRINGLGTSVRTVYDEVVYADPTSIEKGVLIVGGPPKPPPPPKLAPGTLPADVFAPIAGATPAGQAPALLWRPLPSRRGRRGRPGAAPAAAAVVAVRAAPCGRRQGRPRRRSDAPRSMVEPGGTPAAMAGPQGGAAPGSRARLAKRPKPRSPSMKSTASDSNGRPL